MKANRMREMRRYKLDVTRITVVTLILLGVLGTAALFGQTRIGFGPTRAAQDPVPASPPGVTLTPDNLDFGNQVVGRTSASRRITVKNTGGSPLSVDSVDLGGDNPTAFAILKDTCTGATVEPNRACIVDVTFTPARTGGRNANLKLNDNAPDSPQRLRLKGNGINASAVPPF